MRKIFDPANIRCARQSDITLMKHLQRKLPHALGFMPESGLKECIRRKWVNIANLNGQSAGFLLARDRLGCSPTLRPIIQAAVHFDAQRRHIGLALLHAEALKAKADGLEGLQCWCAADLEANEFWKAAGFLHVGTKSPDNVLQRDLLLWRLPLTWPLQTSFFGRPARSGHLGRPSIKIDLEPIAQKCAQLGNDQRLELLTAENLRYTERLAA